jgi:hypothetical protein
MARGINLRGDLAKLDDAELAARLQDAWVACEVATQRPRWSWLLYSHRGPIRHPRAYRFLSVLSGGTTTEPWLDLLLAALLSSKRFEGLITPDSATARHLALCEISDINDEIKRRLRLRDAAESRRDD